MSGDACAVSNARLPASPPSCCYVCLLGSSSSSSEQRAASSRAHHLQPQLQQSSSDVPARRYSTRTLLAQRTTNSPVLRLTPKNFHALQNVTVLRLPEGTILVRARDTSRFLHTSPLNVFFFYHAYSEIYVARLRKYQRYHKCCKIIVL